MGEIKFPPSTLTLGRAPRDPIGVGRGWRARVLLGEGGNGRETRAASREKDREFRGRAGGGGNGRRGREKADTERELMLKR